MYTEERLRNPGETDTDGQFDSDFGSQGAGGWFIRELNALTRYFGYPTLAEGLVRAGIKRGVEVGVGRALSSNMIAPLARLHFDGQAVFVPKDIWAIDPVLGTDEDLLAIGSLGKYRDLFTRVPISAEVLREQVAAGAVSPFDLVISTGVVAIGSTLFGFDDRQGYEKGLTIIEAMRGCLNPQNPKAILALFDYFQDMFIPCAPSHLTHLGLKVVYGRESTWEEARIRHQALRESGLVPPDERVFYSEMICQVA